MHTTLAHFYSCHFFVCILSGDFLNTKIASNSENFFHPPSAKDVARDLIYIADSWCEPEHGNGNACEFGASMERLALLYVQQCQVIRTVKGKGMQEEIIQTGLTMGGAGFGSKYNTRVIYVPVCKDHEDDSPLTDVTFKYFDSYMIDYVENRIAKGLPVPSTQLRHDSGVVVDGITTFIHEARSQSMDIETLKVVLGECKMLPYTKYAPGMVTNGRTVT